MGRLKRNTEKEPLSSCWKAHDILEMTERGMANDGEKGAVVFPSSFGRQFVHDQ
jgi:hypothetical protein